MRDASSTDGLQLDSSAASAAERRRFSPLPPLLLLLALADLRTDLLLLLDQFTFTTLITAITTHPLAVVVLLAQPSLWRRYSRARR